MAEWLFWAVVADALWLVAGRAALDLFVEARARDVFHRRQLQEWVDEMPAPLLWMQVWPLLLLWMAGAEGRGE